MQPLWRAELAIVVGAWVFGSAGLFVKWLEMPATVLAGFRLFLPGLILLCAMPELRRRIITVYHPRLMLASCLTAVRIFLWVQGLAWAPMGKAAVILFTWPIIFALLGICWGQEKLAPAKLWLLLLSVLGLLLLQSDTEWSWRSQETLGLLCMLASALLYACNMFIYKQALASASPMEVVLRDCLVGGVIYLPFVLWYLPEFSLLQFSAASGYAVLVGLVGYGLVYYGLARVSATTASVLAYNEVLSAAVFGVLIFGEGWSLANAAGAACILLAAALVRRQG